MWQLFNLKLEENPWKSYSFTLQQALSKTAWKSFQNDTKAILQFQEMFEICLSTRVDESPIEPDGKFGWLIAAS